MPTMMIIDMREITRAQYYEDKKDLRKLVISDMPDRYVRKDADIFTLYQTVDGKFYCGRIQNYDYNLVRTMKLERKRTTFVYGHTPPHPLARAS